MTEVGPEKDYFNTGTIHGTFHETITGMASNSTSKVTVTYIGGTGAFAGAKGSSKFTCISTKPKCTEVLKFSRL